MCSNRHPQNAKHNRNFIPSANDLLTLAHGRWREILIDAGFPAECLDSKRGCPCPRCGGRDRFSLLPDFDSRGAVLCRGCFHRDCDPWPGDGFATLRWWLGLDATDARKWLAQWLGITDQTVFNNSPRPVVRRLSIPGDHVSDQALMETDCQRWAEYLAERPSWHGRIAELLGLPVEPIKRLKNGWAPEYRATTWPMRDANGRVIGVRLRCPKTGRKWAVRRSRAGLFYDPALLDRESVTRLYVAEGPTDTAALLSLGLDAAGIPSAGNGGALLAELCRAKRIAEMAIIADADGAGQQGALRVARDVCHVAQVRIVTPAMNAKDARAWVIAGADRACLERAAEDAPVHSLLVKGGSSDE